MPDPLSSARTRRRRAARACWFALAPAAAFAATAGDEPRPECAHGVCAMPLDLRPAGPPCAGMPLLAAWAQDGGATLVQCGNAVDGRGNRGFVFDRGRADGRVVELADARVFAATALPRFATVGVPGTFGLDPLCKPPDAALPGQILLLAKTAAGCLRVLRAQTDAAGAVVRADDGSATPPAPGARTTWRALAARVQALVPPAPGRAVSDAPATATASPARSAAVSARQAWLFDVPEAGLPSHNWLDRGTRVTVLDATRDPAWVKIRYVGQAGRPVERWVHRADLDIPG